MFGCSVDHFAGVELDALKSSIESLKARFKRYAKSSKAKGHSPSQQRQILRRNMLQDTQISQLKSSLAKLSLVNSENTKKVKVIESALKSRDSSKS